MNYALVRARTWLFTPASRPHRFERAVSSGSDVVVLDLEDQVADADKAEARKNVVSFLKSAPIEGPALVVRASPLSRLAGIEDMAALARAGSRLDGVIVSRAEAGEHMRIAAAALADAGSPAQVMGLIESAKGVSRAEEIATGGTRMAGLMFGAVGYAADLGQRTSVLAAEHARAAVVNAAAIGGLVAIDGASAVETPEALADACEAARALGFFGKAANHPAHLAAIGEIFAPKAEDYTLARRVLRAAPKGIGLLDGRPINSATLRWARRVAGDA